MPTATPSVYRKFHKYNNVSREDRPAKLELDELRIDSSYQINISLPDTYTILFASIPVKLMGETSLEVEEMITGDTFSEAVEKAKERGAKNIRVILGPGSYLS